MSNDIRISVGNVLDRWSKSRFYRRACCLSEKAVNKIVVGIIAAGLAVFAILQVVEMFISYANPVVSSVTVYNTSFVLPGFLICMPAPADISAPAANTIYADPRLSFEKFAFFPYDENCCFSYGVDYFTACMDAKCPLPSYWVTGAPTQYGSMSVTFQCMKTSVGFNFASNAQSLWLPFYLKSDTGLLSVDGSGQRSSNETLPENDIAWNSFVQQYVYWPQKLVLTSFDAPENSTNPATLYFTPTSSGQSARIRSDIAWGLSSFLLTHYLTFDYEKRYVPQRSGFVIIYENSLGGLPWTNDVSEYHPKRTKPIVVGFVRIHVNTAVVTSNEVILITYTVVVTTLLAIISSSTVFLNVLVGPGEHDPTGLLYKLFYTDVPTLLQTKSTAVFKIDNGAVKKKSDADAAEAAAEDADPNADNDDANRDESAGGNGSERKHGSGGQKGNDDGGSDDSDDSDTDADDDDDDADDASVSEGSGEHADEDDEKRADSVNGTMPHHSHLNAFASASSSSSSSANAASTLRGASQLRV